MKFNPYGLAAAALAFVLSIVLVYAAYGGVPTIFDGVFPLEEEYHHCSG